MAGEAAAHDEDDELPSNARVEVPVVIVVIPLVCVLAFCFVFCPAYHQVATFT